MHDKLRNGDVRARKDWLNSVLERIEVGDDSVKLIGNKQVLAAAVTGQNTAPAHVRGFVRKWRARQDSNLLPQD
jgi:site-specific DNA recombinase